MNKLIPAVNYSSFPLSNLGLQEEVVALGQLMFIFFSCPANPNFAKQLQIPLNSLVNYFMLFSRLRKKQLVWVPPRYFLSLVKRIHHLIQIAKPKRKFPEMWTIDGNFGIVNQLLFYQINIVHKDNHFYHINSNSWDEASQKYHPSESVPCISIIHLLIMCRPPCTVTMFLFTCQWTS